VSEPFEIKDNFRAVSIRESFILQIIILDSKKNGHVSGFIGI